MINIQSIIGKIFHDKNIRNGIIFSLFSFLNSGIGFLMMLVMAHYLTPESYGKLGLFTTMISLLSIFICLNTIGLLGVNFFTKSKKEIRKYLNMILIIGLFVYFFLLLSLFVFNSFLHKAVGLETNYQIYAISICLLQLFSSILMEVWRLEERVWQYGIFSSFIVILNLFLTILLVGPLKLDWQGRVYAQIITCGVFAILSIIILIKKKYLKLLYPQIKYIKEGLGFGLPLIPHSVSFWLRQGLDRYVINYSLSQLYVGFFSFASNFANIIQIVGFSFNASNSVNIYKILSDNNIHDLRYLYKCFRSQTLFYICLTLLIFFGAAVFIPILFPKYRDSILYLLPLCLGSMFQCFYLIYVNVLIFFKKTQILMYITLSCSLLHCALSFWLTHYGIIYTACISVLSNVLIFLGVYYYAKILLKQHFYIKKCNIE